MNENNLAKTREGEKKPFVSIANEKVKIETKLSSLNEFINKSDTAFADYTYKGERNKNIKPLYQLFRNRTIVFTLIEKKYL